MSPAFEESHLTPMGVTDQLNFIFVLFRLEVDFFISICKFFCTGIWNTYLVEILK